MKQKNNDKSAIALKYQHGDIPRVTAKGQNQMAEAMIALAQEHDIYLHEDEQLTEILSYLSLGDAIPETLYRIIAEVIAFAYILDGRFPEDWHDKVQQPSNE